MNFEEFCRQFQKVRFKNTSALIKVVAMFIVDMSCLACAMGITSSTPRELSIFSGKVAIVSWEDGICLSEAPGAMLEKRGRVSLSFFYSSHLKIMSWKIQFPFEELGLNFRCVLGLVFGECIFVEGDIGKHQTTPKHPAFPSLTAREPEQMMETSKFRISNSKFGISNSKFGIPNFSTQMTLSVLKNPHSLKHHP